MEELDLKEILSMFWSKRSLITIIICILIIVGLIYTMFIVKPEYQAKTTLVLTKANSNKDNTSTDLTNSDVTLNSNLIATYTDIFTSDKVINQVIENLKKEGIEDLDKTEIKKNVEIEIKSEGSNVLEMTITSNESEKAMQIANEMAKVGIVEIKEKMEIDNIKVLDEATENEEPSNVNHTRDIIIFAIIGIIIAFGYVLITYMLDNTVKSAEDIEKTCKTIVLASIPLYEKQPKKGGRK